MLCSLTSFCRRAFAVFPIFSVLGSPSFPRQFSRSSRTAREDGGKAHTQTYTRAFLFCNESAAILGKTMTTSKAFPLPISPSPLSIPSPPPLFPLAFHRCVADMTRVLARCSVCLPRASLCLCRSYARIPLSSSPPQSLVSLRRFSQVHGIHVVNSGVSAPAQVSSGACWRWPDSAD